MKLENTKYTIYHMFDDPCWKFGSDKFFDAFPLINLEASLF